MGKAKDLSSPLRISAEVWAFVFINMALLCYWLGSAVYYIVLQRYLEQMKSKTAPCSLIHSYRCFRKTVLPPSSGQKIKLSVN
jgi:hypothetical protein